MIRASELGEREGRFESWVDDDSLFSYSWLSSNCDDSSVAIANANMLGDSQWREDESANGIKDVEISMQNQMH